MTQKVTYNERYGGISNDKRQRKKGEYYFSEGIDVRNDGKAFQLYGVNKTTLSNPTIAGTPLKLTSVLANPDVGPDLFGFETGHLMTSLGDIYEPGIDGAITDIAIYGDYCYLVHGYDVSRWKIDLTANDLNIGAITGPFFEYAGEDCHSIYAPDDSSDYAYLYGGKDIYRFDDTTGAGTLPILRSFKAGDKVKRITRVGSNYNIYMRNSKLIVPGSITDDVSNQKLIEFKGYNIVDAINDGNADFVLVEDEVLNRTSILYSSGYESQSLYTTRGGEKSPYDNERIVFDNANNNISKLTRQGNIIYISGGDNGRLYSLGKQYNELPMSLAVDYAGSSSINCIGQVEDGVVIGNDTNVELIKLVDPEDTQSYNGYLETNPFVGKELSAKKRLKNLRLGYNIPDTTGSYYIKLYIKTDEGSYELIDTIDSDAGMGEKTYTVSKEFHSLQMKVEIDKTDVQSPQVFDLTFTYDLIKDGLR